MLGVVLASEEKTKLAFVQRFLGKFFPLTPQRNSISSHIVEIEEGIYEELSLSINPYLLEKNNIAIYYILLDLHKPQEQLEQDIFLHLNEIEKNGNPKALKVFLGNYYHEVNTVLLGKGLQETIKKLPEYTEKNPIIKIISIKKNKNITSVFKDTIVAALSSKKDKGSSALEDKIHLHIEKFKGFLEDKIKKLSRGYHLVMPEEVTNKIILLEDLKDYVKYPILGSMNTFLDRYPANTVETCYKIQLELLKLYEEFKENLLQHPLMLI